MENRFKKIREDFEFTNDGYKLTTDKLAEIFKQRGYTTLNASALRKIETDKRKVTEYELKGYREVFNTTSDYLLGFIDTPSQEKNEQMISEITGLSSRSIYHLKCLKYLNNTDIDILNFILSDGYFFEFIRGIKLYLENNYNIVMTDKIIPGTNSIEHVPREIPEYDKDGKEIFWLGKKTDNGYGCIPLTTDIVEAHAMLIIQDVLKKWQDKYKKESD